MALPASLVCNKAGSKEVMELSESTARRVESKGSMLNGSGRMMLLEGKCTVLQEVHKKAVVVGQRMSEQRGVLVLE